jgi:hypothetical protein
MNNNVFLAIAIQNSVVLSLAVYLYHTTGSVYSFLLILLWSNAREKKDEEI